MQALPMSAFELNQQQTDEFYVQNKLPLEPRPYLELPLGAVRPSGWLREQLVRMRNGLTGHLDVMYREVLGSRNGWLGGDGDVWERAPYWLDGLVPLAYILDDEALKSKAQRWIEWTLRSQDDSGYFGPRAPEAEVTAEEGLQRNNAEDWWPRMVMLKVLQQYFNATGDERVLDHMLRYFRYQLRTLPEKPLNHWSWWAEQRGGDNLAMVYWLYNLKGDHFLLELAEIIHSQTYNWADTLLNTEKVSECYSFHCVNIAQGLKEPAIYFQRHNDRKYIDAIKKGLRDLEVHHGHPNGLFGGDEMLHGTNPVHGSELCTAVELMFSLENIAAITGEVEFMDHLERIAFNALPAQTNEDFTARQYYQQINQVLITRTERNFVTSHGHTDLCFGVLTGYPCCTVNMHQGWPKFVQFLWQATSDYGLAALVYSASSVRAKVGGGKVVEFIEETNYPFEEEIRFTFKAEDSVVFPFHLRIPLWCKEAKVTINGENFGLASPGRILIINRLWTDGDVVLLRLPMRIINKRWHEGATTIERGPLIFSLRIAEHWKKVSNDDKFRDFHECYPASPWNYGIVNRSLDPVTPECILNKTEKITDFPWSIGNAPVGIKIKAKRLNTWTLYNGSAGPIPYSPQQHAEGTEEEITLIPYGCTKLRITEFPIVR